MRIGIDGTVLCLAPRGIGRFLGYLPRRFWTRAAASEWISLRTGHSTRPSQISRDTPGPACVLFRSAAAIVLAE